MKRGSVVTVSVQGDFGKARPALVVQSEYFAQHPSVSILQITSKSVEAPLIRIPVEPSAENGLHQPSHISVDKIFTVKREKIGSVIGQMGAETMSAVDRAMLIFLGLAA